MRIILLMIGGLCTLLGCIGIFIPIWPTTPFLILASLCFLRSSKKAHALLYRNKYFGPYLQHYHTKQGVYRKEKIKAYLFLWISILFSMAIVQNMVMNSVLIVILLCVTMHIMCIKTREVKHEEKSATNSHYGIF